MARSQEHKRQDVREFRTQPMNRFPPPWRVVEMAGCFVVQDATGQNVAWFAPWKQAFSSLVISSWRGAPYQREQMGRFQRSSPGERLSGTAHRQIRYPDGTRAPLWGWSMAGGCELRQRREQKTSKWSEHHEGAEGRRAKAAVDPANPVGNPGPLPPIQTKFDPRLTTRLPGKDKTNKVPVRPPGAGRPQGIDQ
jgi:hypothetical protein